jgi:hypothetical protein
MPVHRKAENRVRTKLLFRDPELNVDGKAAQQAENLQPRTRPRIVRPRKSGSQSARRQAEHVAKPFSAIITCLALA